MAAETAGGTRHASLSSPHAETVHTPAARAGADGHHRFRASGWFRKARMWAYDTRAVLAPPARIRPTCGGRPRFAAPDITPAALDLPGHPRAQAPRFHPAFGALPADRTACIGQAGHAASPELCARRRPRAAAPAARYHRVPASRMRSAMYHSAQRWRSCQTSVRARGMHAARSGKVCACTGIARRAGTSGLPGRWTRPSPNPGRATRGRARRASMATPRATVAAAGRDGCIGPSERAPVAARLHPEPADLAAPGAILDQRAGRGLASRLAAGA